MNKKYLILGIILGMVFIGLVIWQFLGKNKQETTTITPTPAVTSNQPPEDLELKSPKRIDWQDSGSSLATETNNWKVVKADDTEIINKLAKILGLGDLPIKNINNLIEVDNPQSYDSLYLDKKLGTIQYSKNLLTNKLGAVKNPKTTQEIEQSLIDLLENNIWSNQNIKLEIVSDKYESINGPRFVTTTADKAEIIKVDLAYGNESGLILGYNGAPISVRLSRDGTIVWLAMERLISGLSQTNKSEMKTIGEIKNQPASNFYILNITGGSEFDKSSVEEDINTVTITRIYLGYIYDPNRDDLIPYVFGEGNSILSTGAVTLIIGTPAGK